jgi:hypothetical protein
LLFGLKRDEVTREWRKLHNEEPNDPQYCPGAKIEKNEMAGACSTYGEVRGMYKVLAWKPGGMRPMGRPRHRWEDNIKMVLQEVGCGCNDWIEQAEDRDRWQALVNVVMEFLE